MRAGIPAIIAVLLGCASRPHVRLEAPAPSASEDDRLRAYEKLRAQPQSSYLGETFEDLQLGDGTRVWHAEDVLPVVPPRSQVARAARDSRSSRETAAWLRYGGFAVIVGGTVWLAMGLSGDPDAFVDSTPFGIAMGVIGVGVVVAALSAIPEWEANDATTVAFRSYDRALRRRLDLCVASFQVVACNRARETPE